MLEIEDTDIEEPDKSVQGLPARRTIPVLGGPRAGDRSKDEYGLMPRQRVFCDEWLICRNATRSAILAGYSVKNASSIGTDLMKVPAVARYLAMREAERQDDVEARRQRLLEELEILSHSDLTRFVRQGNTVRVVPGTDPKETRALSKIKMKSRTYTQDDGTEVTEHEAEIAAHSKTASVDMYMKHLGMYPSTSKINIEDGEGNNVLVIEEVVE